MPKTNVERHSLRNGIIATVVGGLILTAILSPVFRQWISLFIATAWKLITGTWHYLLSSVAIPRYLLGLLILLSFITLLRAIRPLFKSQSVAEPTWESYTQDEFFGMVWRWDYARDPMRSLRPYCPRCDTLLVYSEDVTPHLTTQTHFSCETCQRNVQMVDSDYRSLLERLTRQIDRKLRTGDWKQAVTKFTIEQEQ